MFTNYFTKLKVLPWFKPRPVTDGKSILRRAPFDGRVLGNSTAISTMSTGDNLRGWSWDGTTATYITVTDGKSILRRAPFDGRVLGNSTAISTMSTGDNRRGWSWDGTTATFIHAAKRE